MIRNRLRTGCNKVAQAARPFQSTSFACHATRRSKQRLAGTSLNSFGHTAQAPDAHSRHTRDSERPAVGSVRDTLPSPRLRSVKIQPTQLQYAAAERTEYRSP